MKKNPDTSIYPALVAEFIEASKDGGTLDAIIFLTHEKLATLKNDHQRKIQADIILKEARLREAKILDILPELIYPEGKLTLPLSQEIKQILQPIREDILFLYEQRMGKEAARGLLEVFNSGKDEPVSLIITYKKNTETDTYFIKKIYLEKIK